jgi:hypothetical protein
MQFNRLANLKTILIKRKIWHVRASKTEIDRTFMRNDRVGGANGFAVIGRNHHRHSRQTTHQPNIFENLVGGTIFAQRQTGVRSANFDIEIGVADRLANLVIDPTGGKDGKTCGNRNFARRGKTSSHRDHVRLSNAGLDKTVRKSVAEKIHVQ